MMVEIGRSEDCVSALPLSFIYIWREGVGFTGSIRSAGVGGK